MLVATIFSLFINNNSFRLKNPMLVVVFFYLFQIFNLTISFHIDQSLIGIFFLVSFLFFITAYIKKNPLYMCVCHCVCLIALPKKINKSNASPCPWSTTFLTVFVHCSCDILFNSDKIKTCCKYSKNEKKKHFVATHPPQIMSLVIAISIDNWPIH